MAKYKVGDRAYAICYGKLARVQVCEINTREHYLDNDEIVYTVWYNKNLSSDKVRECDMHDLLDFNNFDDINTSKFKN